MFTPEEQTMRCMEVWGGNQPVDSSVAMAGLDAWVYCSPYKDASGGGDVYYVSACATGRITRLLVADVSGHGTEVSPLGGELRRLMRRYVNFLDQTQFVRSLNSKFTTLSAGGHFATAVVCTYFGPTRRLTLCNAGHPPPLLYSARANCWAALDQAETGCGNIPWGIDEVCSYDQFDVRLGAGDMVLVYTDSLVEARNAQGNLLGYAKLMALASSLDAASPATLTADLLKLIRSEGFETDDDVTVLLFRPNANSPRAPLTERLKMPGRMASAFVKSLRRGGDPMPWPDFNLANIAGAFFHPFEWFWRNRVSQNRS